MAIDRRQGGKVQQGFRREEAVGTRVDPYPYIGVVKNNLDPLRTGRLSVWIADFGGEETDSKNWRTVSYASPYMGTTNVPTKGSKTNSWTEAPHTYGMWMVPPDIGVEVIVIFIGGDPLNGYWTACVNSNTSRHMLPGMASSTSADFSNSSSEVKKGYNNVLNPKLGAPVTEFNPNDATLASKPNFLQNAKPIHEKQYNVLRAQGLDRDTVRGLTSSSSQRETPSQVFGISTPGRPFPDPKDNPTLLQRIADGETTADEFVYKTRQGGHQFVMDDGDFLGNNQLLRLRTAGGHQVMLNDSGNAVYIGHADGTAWLEFDMSGRIQIYSKSGIDIRTEGEFNLRADSNINIDAGGALKIKTGAGTTVNTGSQFEVKAGGAVALESGGKTELKSNSNFVVDSGGSSSFLSSSRTEINGSKVDIQNGGGVSIPPMDPLKTNILPDTKLNTATGLWINETGLLETITTKSPSHEPSYRPPSGTATSGVTAGFSPILSVTALGPVPFAGSAGITVEKPATDKDLRNQPPSPSKIGPLDNDQVTAYMAQIGKSESSNNYTAVNSIGYLGKYQFGYMALIDAGLIKKSVTSNSQLDLPDNWIRTHCGSKEEFLTNKTLQEETMQSYTKRNYNALIRIGVINSKNKDDPEEVAGWLATSHLLGPGGAKKVAIGEGGADAFGTSGTDYFQRGKYSIAVLATKLPAIQAG